jgi:HPt (histidine-containing phosphotransfer) domain-containing protein
VEYREAVVSHIQAGRGEGTLTEAVDHRVLAALSQATGDDPAFLAELIDTYLANAPALVVAMRDALAAREAAGLRRAAHTLKSTSATLGAHRLADLCRHLEAAEGSAETFAQAEDEYLRAAELLGRIEGEYASVERALQEIT